MLNQARVIAEMEIETGKWYIVIVQEHSHSTSVSTLAECFYSREEALEYADSLLRGEGWEKKEGAG